VDPETYLLDLGITIGNGATWGLWERLPAVTWSGTTPFGIGIQSHVIRGTVDTNPYTRAGRGLLLRLCIVRHLRVY